MASTNKTTHYELSQFLGTDKPAWLTDYNTDMSKIDTGINTAQATATGADGKADTNATNIGNLENLTTSTKTSVVAAINEVDGHADSAQETANAASLLANTNKTNLDNFKGMWNLDTVLSYDSAASVTLSQCSAVAINLKIARDTNGDIFKLYGSYAVNPTVGTGNLYSITLPNTGIATDTPYTIYPVGITTGNNIVDDITVTVNNNSITIQGGSRGNGVTSNGRLFPCIYFNTDFGDTPS